MTPPTAGEQDDALAFIAGAIADGKPVTPLDKAILRLRLVRQAQDRGLSWAQIGSVYGISGKEMKREIHHLARRVQPGLTAAKRRR